MKGKCYKFYPKQFMKAISTIAIALLFIIATGYYLYAATAYETKLMEQMKVVNQIN